MKVDHPRFRQILWGDGKHDDTEALQHLIDNNISISNGIHLVLGTLHFHPTSNCGISNCRLLGGKKLRKKSNPVIWVHTDKNKKLYASQVFVMNNIIVY